jgi:cysteine desulfurase/selenocysteine lyase
MTPTAAAARGLPGYDVAQVRADFPILRRQVRGRPLVYLDNAATTQKPQVVLVHHLSEIASEAFEGSRRIVASYFNAPDAATIVFTRNATESINLVAQTFGRTRVGAGDEVLISAMEHHSNIVPWQLLCAEKGATLRVAPMDDAGELLLDEFAAAISGRTKLVAVTQMSNALGTVNPVEEIVRIAHARSVPVLIDGSQAAYHMAVDVQALDCDFYVATGHKLYGPTGIGVLYGKAEHLEAMPPFMGGGDMISSVTFEGSTWNSLPHKFEAGTPHISGPVGLAAAIRFVQGVGFDAIGRHEAALLEYGTRALEAVPGLTIIGTAPKKASVLSFTMEGIHPHDIGTIVDQDGVAIRTGHHCAQPVMERFGIPATARASLAMYNTTDDIDTLVRALTRVQKLMG